ncbi:hypothetical protein Plhal703r1_c15g0072241 [Plasmopara halstedii]
MAYSNLPHPDRICKIKLDAFNSILQNARLYAEGLDASSETTINTLSGFALLPLFSIHLSRLHTMCYISSDIFTQCRSTGLFFC